MPNKFECLSDQGGFAVLEKPDDPELPSVEVAPFELEEARPLKTYLGEYLTSPDTVHSEDAPPSIVLNHSTNPELTVWVNRYITSSGRSKNFFVLACYDQNQQFYYEIPKRTVKSVLSQAIDGVYWGITHLDDDLLKSITDNL